MKTEYEKVLQKATKLVAKLTKDIKTGKREITENYGQSEIAKFSEKYCYNLHYTETCKIFEILNKVSEIC